MSYFDQARESSASDLSIENLMSIGDEDLKAVVDDLNLIWLSKPKFVDVIRVCTKRKKLDLVLQLLERLDDMIRASDRDDFAKAREVIPPPVYANMIHNGKEWTDMVPILVDFFKDGMIHAGYFDHDFIDINDIGVAKCMLFHCQTCYDRRALLFGDFGNAEVWMEAAKQIDAQIPLHLIAEELIDGRYPLERILLYIDVFEVCKNKGAMEKLVSRMCTPSTSLCQESDAAFKRRFSVYSKFSGELKKHLARVDLMTLHPAAALLVLSSQENPDILGYVELYLKYELHPHGWQEPRYFLKDLVRAAVLCLSEDQAELVKNKICSERSPDAWHTNNFICK